MRVLVSRFSDPAYSSLLEPRRRSEKALLSVIQQAYVEGVSTRRVDDLIKALGCDGISSSQVSRICEQLDEVVDSFLGRPLDGGPYPYVWLDGLTQKVREGGRIVNVCVVVATGVNAEGQREILGMDVGASDHRGWQGRRVLAGLPAVADRSGPQRGGAGDLRCPPGAEERHRRSLCWSQLAALPHPLHGQPAQRAGRGRRRCRRGTAPVPKRAQPGVATQDLLAWYAPSTSNCLPPRSTANWTEWWNNSGSPFPRWPNCCRPVADAAPDILASRPSQWPTGRSCGPTTRRNG